MMNIKYSFPSAVKFVRCSSPLSPPLKVNNPPSASVKETLIFSPICFFASAMGESMLYFSLSHLVEKRQKTYPWRGRHEEKTYCIRNLLIYFGCAHIHMELHTLSPCPPTGGFTSEWQAIPAKPLVTELFAILGVGFLFCSLASLLARVMFFAGKK